MPPLYVIFSGTQRPHAAGQDSERGMPEAHDFHHSLNGGRNLDNLGQVDVLDRVLHTNKEFLKSWQYTVHKGYTPPDYPVDKALATTEKPLPA